MTTLKCHITKFCQCEPLTLINHLYAKYGTITCSYLTANFDCMTACCNPPTPITELFQQLNYRKDFAEEGNEITNDRKLLRLCYDNVHASGMFSKTLKIWREKSDMDKTYANFFPFRNQQEEDRLNNQPTCGTASFSNAMVDNIVHEKMQELINQMGNI